jgi:hypothetical protein
MKDTKKLLDIESKIAQLKTKLNNIISADLVTADKVMELSRELDVLIVRYYNLKKQAKVDI